MKQTPNPDKLARFSERQVSSYFGELTFGLGEMRNRLGRKSYDELLRSLEQGRTISEDSADAIAQVIKEWSVSRGVTHFCHWFQPMTGLTAEKHDAFISIQHTNHSELVVIESFTGSQLIQGEPDASSFPSGGMRSTFEARGYTAWDPNSPLFIIEEGQSKTLCIPSVFFGYHGQALDNKTPLLRSNQALSKAACRFLKLIGDVDVRSVTPTLGAEQEYFLIDKKDAERRPDLMMTGRTLLGAPSAKGQKLEDHYFGSIPPRVKLFMEELEQELYRLGVPVKTRHNEVAPSQFEMAPIFEHVSIASDHNTLTMETMKRIAAKHGYMCLLHEKPFAGVNGSGKHCNWSITNDKGENLLDPGKTPHQNLRFLALIAVVVNAVHQNGSVLAASILSAGNEHRLGANEAPPGTISVFLGSMLDTILESILKGEAAQATQEEIINLDVSHLPTISRDYTDRNRTSPFAFTGNKFEFRAVGSSANVAVSTSMLNAAVSDALDQAADRLEKILSKKKSRDESVMALIQELVKDSNKVIFSGNNYSDEWRAEASKRGLPDINNCRDAIAVLSDEPATDFLIRTGVLSRDEINSRRNIFSERYLATIAIEHKMLLELVNDFVVPAIEQQLLRSHAINGAIESNSLKDPYHKRVSRLEGTLAKILVECEKLSDIWNYIDSGDEMLRLDRCCDEAIPLATSIRNLSDNSERNVADEFWRLPKYRELLFHTSMKL